MPELSSFCLAHSGVSLLLIHSAMLPDGSSLSLKSGPFGFRLFDMLFHHKCGFSMTDRHFSSALLSLVWQAHQFLSP